MGVISQERWIRQEIENAISLKVNKSKFQWYRELCCKHGGRVD